MRESGPTPSLFLRNALRGLMFLSHVISVHSIPGKYLKSNRRVWVEEKLDKDSVVPTLFMRLTAKRYAKIQ